MKTVVPFPNDQTTREQAASWIARLDRGLSATESGELQKWIGESRANREALLAMSSLWDRLDILAEMAELFPLESRRRRRPWRQPRVAIATFVGVAVLAIVAAVLWVGSGRSRPAASGAPAVEAASFRTKTGEQRLITLSDESVVALNTDTEVSTHYTATDRLIDLVHGEAHFKVAKDARRVFTVRVGGNEFKAVGTAFNLRRTSEEGVELTVMEGRVKVLVTPSKNDNRPDQRGPSHAESSPMFVDAGAGLTIDNARQTVRALQPGRVEAKVAWTHGMMVFDGEPLEGVINEVSRYSTIKFVIADDNIRRIPVAGYFKIGDIDGLVAALQANFNIVASRGDGTITLGVAPPK